MYNSTYTDGEGNQVTEIHDTQGRLVSRTVVSTDGDTTNIARGGVGIQAKNVTGKTVRR